MVNNNESDYYQNIPELGDEPPTIVGGMEKKLSEQSPSVISPGYVMGGNYELVREVGRGSLGQVWEARDLSGNRKVVIKVIPGNIQNQPAVIHQVYKAFHLIESLQHEHICPVHYMGNDPQHGIFLVMRYIPGESLTQYMRRFPNSRIPHSEILTLMRALGSAVDYAHKKGVLHRDIKPSNIMIELGPNNDIKDVQLIDFDLATQFQEQVTQDSLSVFSSDGTRQYMPPEQLLARDQSEQTDIYSLGITAWQLMTGALPFQDSDQGALLDKILHMPVPVISDGSSAINAVFQRVLEKEPAKRYATCNDFVEALSNAVTTDKTQKTLHRSGSTFPTLTPPKLNTPPAVIPPLRPMTRKMPAERSKPPTIPVQEDGPLPSTSYHNAPFLEKKPYDSINTTTGSSSLHSTYLFYAVATCVGLFCGVGFLAFIGWPLWIALFYKLWNIPSPSTPKKDLTWMVIGCFIPFFNLYWTGYAVSTLARQRNRELIFLGSEKSINMIQVSLYQLFRIMRFFACGISLLTLTSPVAMLILSIWIFIIFISYCLEIRVMYECVQAVEEVTLLYTRKNTLRIDDENQITS